MRDDTSFSDRKLTREEFSHKYWMDGSAEYQYHTADIEDGRDEREQFIINNCRALWDALAWHKKYYHGTWPEIAAQRRKGRKEINKATALAVTGAIAGVISLALSMVGYFLK